MVYCVVAPEVAPRIRRLLERALSETPEVTVVAERRQRDRRARGDRRDRRSVARRRITDRRRIRYEAGRRVAERRAAVVPVAGPSLPRRIAPFAGGIAFVEALDTPAALREDVAAVRSIIRFQAGEEAGLADLYERWFDRLYAYMHVALHRAQDAEARTCSVLATAVHELKRAAPAPAMVRPWLFGLAYREASPIAVEAALSSWRRRRATRPVADEDRGLEWLTDDELLLFVQRRPLPERHALVLRYLAGLGFADIAAVMDMQPRDAIALHREAVSSLEATLAELGRSPQVGGRLEMARLGHQTPVLYRRRRALLAA